MQELELRLETQKAALQSREDSIRKLLEMVQSKGQSKDEEQRQMIQTIQVKLCRLWNTLI